MKKAFNLLLVFAICISGCVKETCPVTHRGSINSEKKLSQLEMNIIGYWQVFTNATRDDKNPGELPVISDTHGVFNSLTSFYTFYSNFTFSIRDVMFYNSSHPADTIIGWGTWQVQDAKYIKLHIDSSAVIDHSGNLTTQLYKQALSGDCTFIIGIADGKRLSFTCQGSPDSNRPGFYLHYYSEYFRTGNPKVIMNKSGIAQQ